MTWDNVDPSCMLCDMDKRTKWYYEDDLIVVADTLGSNPHPFIVLKEHKREAEEYEKGYMKATAKQLFGECELEYRGRMVPDHYHCHIVQRGRDIDLSKE